MPDILDADGLQIKSLTEVRDELETDLQNIFGSDINTDQNSPDGQQINIYAQGGIDLREVVQKVYNGFNPNLAEGKVLDQRVAINDIQRNLGTYSTTPVTLTYDKVAALIGLDAESSTLIPDIEGLFTVKDDEGTLFYLITSVTTAGAGSSVHEFRAAELGQVEILPNTITTQQVIVSGITAVNNPSQPTTIGIDEETDIALKVRNVKAAALRSYGYLDSIIAGLNNITGVVNAYCYENVYSSTDADGIPSHSIWAIVEGGADADIGEVLYKKRGGGCGMKGAVEVVVPRNTDPASNASMFFDRVVLDDLYIKMTITGFYNDTTVKDGIVADIIWDVGQPATSDVISCYVKGLYPDAIITEVRVSTDGVVWAEIVAAPDKKTRYNNDAPNISINGV